LDSRHNAQCAYSVQLNHTIGVVEVCTRLHVGLRHVLARHVQQVILVARAANQLLLEDAVMLAGLLRSRIVVLELLTR